MVKDLTNLSPYTLENKTNEVVAIRYYLVNFVEKLNPGDTITLTPRTSEELAYYMKIQEGLDGTGDEVIDLLTTENVQKVLDATGNVGTITDFTRVSDTEATFMLEFSNFQQDGKITTEVSEERLEQEGLTYNPLMFTVITNQNKNLYIYDNAIDELVVRDEFTE